MFSVLVSSLSLLAASQQLRGIGYAATSSWREILAGYLGVLDRLRSTPVIGIAFEQAYHQAEAQTKQLAAQIDRIEASIDQSTSAYAATALTALVLGVIGLIINIAGYYRKK